MAQRLFVESLKFVQRAIGVGIGLKIGQIADCIAISPFMKLYSLFYLLKNGFAGVAVRWMECCIVAIGAASGGERAVPVRAGETAVYHYFLQTAAKFFATLYRIGVIPLFHGAKLQN